MMALEPRVISWSLAITVAVVCICLCILTVAGLLFGLAELRSHWP